MAQVLKLSSRTPSGLVGLKDPTISGTILVSSILGNSHVIINIGALTN